MTNFLVVDERGLSELGGHLMIQKLTRPCTVTSIDFNKPSALKGISKHALLMIDKTRLESLVNVVATAVDGGYFKHYAVILLLDSSVAASNDVLPLPRLLPQQRRREQSRRRGKPWRPTWGCGGSYGASRKSQGPTFTGIHYHNW